MNNLIKDIYSSKETALFLGISEASIRNWVKHGYLTPINNSNKYDKDEVHSVKAKIENGEIKRLDKRANKSKSNKTFIPDELLSDSSEKDIIIDIIDYVLKNNIDINATIFFLSINILIKNGLINRNYDIKDLIANGFNISNRKNLSFILNDWFNSLKIDDSQNKINKLLSFNLIDKKDILGIIYQSILEEGKKAKSGSYYTPKFIIDSIAKEYSFRTCKFLDPCCGTGQFLLSFSEFIDRPENIFGIDIDPIAVNITKINLIVKYNNFDFSPNIFNRNALTDFENDSLFDTNILPKFDIIATNPPWGLHFPKNEIDYLSSIYPEIKSEESFSYFLTKGISLLNENGVIIYVLPEAILNVQIHQDIRNHILKNTQIKKIQYINRVFKNVFSPVIILELSNKIENVDTIIIKGKDSFAINQKRFIANSNYVFDIHKNNFDEEIINKVYSVQHVTLKNNADWALGIVTGNNDKFIKYFKIDESYEPIYKGKDVNKYNFSQPVTFIKFEPDLFQQVAPECKYRVSEKLVYRFISNKLVFAYDNLKRLTLNSANIIIPKIPDYNIKLILSLLNSSLYQFIFQKRFSSIKVLRSHVEQLPLPLIDMDDEIKITTLVDILIEGKDEYIKLDNFIFDLFKITDNEKQYILENII